MPFLQTAALEVMVLAGTIHALSEQLAAEEAGARLLPPGKNLGAAVQNGSVNTALLLGNCLSISSEARSLLSGMSLNSAVKYLYKGLKETNAGILNMYQVGWCVIGGDQIRGEMERQQLDSAIDASCCDRAAHRVCHAEMQAWLQELSRPLVAQLYLDTMRGPTSLDNWGVPRSPAGEFIRLAKQAAKKK